MRYELVRPGLDKIVVTTMGTEDSRLQEPVPQLRPIPSVLPIAIALRAFVGGSFASPVLLSNDFRWNRGMRNSSNLLILRLVSSTFTAPTISLTVS